jgi:hypothetical protein
MPSKFVRQRFILIIVFILVVCITIPITFAVVATTTGVAYTDSAGSVSFSQTTYFNAIYSSANLMQFDLTGTLSLNPSSAVNMRISPTNTQTMEISIIDNTEQLYVNQGQVAGSQWFSGNNTLVIYSLTTAQWVCISSSGTATCNPTLLLLAPSTGSHGQSVRLLIIVFNPGNSALNANVTIEITGPGNYIAFDVVQLKVGATSQSTAYYDWTTPNQSGTYTVMVGLLPTKPAAFDAATIQVT